MENDKELAEGRREAALHFAFDHAKIDGLTVEAVIANAAKIEAYLKGAATPAE